MSGATIRDQMVDIVADTLGCEAAAVIDGTSMQQLGADSLDYLEIVMRIEDTCDIAISDAEAAGPKTFGDLVALVERKRGEA